MAHIKNYNINLSMRMTFLGQSQSVMPTEINEFTVDCISSQLLSNDLFNHQSSDSVLSSRLYLHLYFIVLFKEPMVSTKTFTS